MSAKNRVTWFIEVCQDWTDSEMFAVCNVCTVLQIILLFIVFFQSVFKQIWQLTGNMVKTILRLFESGVRSKATLQRPVRLRGLGVIVVLHTAADTHTSLQPRSLHVHAFTQDTTVSASHIPINTFAFFIEKIAARSIYYKQ